MDVTANATTLGASASHLAAAFSQVRTEVLAAAADKLGISVDRLRAEVSAGKPLSDLLAIASTSVERVAVVDEPHGSVDVLI